jgi:hypothetical protein
LIAVLQEARVVVYGHDHRGHGRTARSPEEFGDYGNGGFDLLVEDMAELTRIAKEENPEQPFLLLSNRRLSGPTDAWQGSGNRARQWLAIRSATARQRHREFH